MTAASVAGFGLAAAMVLAALLLSPACADETGELLAETPIATPPEPMATPEPTATPENLALKAYLQRVQSIMDRRTETQEAADEAIDALKAAAGSILPEPVRPRPRSLSTMTEEEITRMFTGGGEPQLSDVGERVLTDTDAKLWWVVKRAQVEWADLQALEVPAEAQHVHGRLIASLSKQNMAWTALRIHCLLVLDREVRWDQTQLDSAEGLLLEAKVDRLEAELELRDLADTPSVPLVLRTPEATFMPATPAAGGTVEATAVASTPMPEASPSPAEPFEYTVESGDSLLSIAEYWLPAGEDLRGFANRIAELNGLDPEHPVIMEGDVLLIPR